MDFQGALLCVSSLYPVSFPSFSMLPTSLNHAKPVSDQSAPFPWTRQGEDVFLACLGGKICEILLSFQGDTETAPAKNKMGYNKE